MIKDEQLIKNYLGGDEEAISILINRYLKEVYLYFLKRLNNSIEAEDLTQETFVKMWRNLEKFDQKRNFRAWLFTIAKNSLIDFLRKHRTTEGLAKEVAFSQFINEEEESILDDIPTLDPSVIEQIEENENWQKLETIISELPIAQRELLLSYLQSNDVTFQKLAQENNISVNTLKARYYRLVQKIRKLFFGSN
ncbi:MAG: sigma-70 family RNA polymerase sigma factor [Candidatus Pacebacteria bacterium]|nr:sigma-70 family RNA polymerase sigma factor [Candidatus Paceibacterota bacterium]